MDRLYQSPTTLGLSTAVWTLALLRQCLPAFSGLSTDSAVFYRLRRWAIRRKVGRLHIQSPDPLYAEKVQAVRAVLEDARKTPEKVRLLYADEFTYYRQPFLGRIWSPQGPDQPTASWKGGGAKTKRRVAGALDAVSGQVVFRQASVMGVEGLCRFLGDIRSAYGPEPRIALAWDNWPVHYHDEVVRTAREQGVELLYIPTYAPWTNPIEKLWKWLKDACLRFHTHADKDAWPALWDAVDAFLHRFQQPSKELLRYTGLALPD